MKYNRYVLLVVLTLATVALSAHKRVLYIGDSITDGAWGNNPKWNATSDERNQTDMNHIYGHGYMMLCASYFQSKYPEREFLFYNRGISGNTLNDIAARWQHDVIDIKPDVVNVLVGTNDVLYFLGEKEKSKAKLNESGGNNLCAEDTFDISGWASKYRQLIVETRKQLPQTKFVLCSPFVAKAGWVGERADYAERSTIIAKMAKAVERIAKEEGCIYIAYDEMFAKLRAEHATSNNSYWIWDGIHPTPAGHKRMADLWIKKAAKLVVK